MGEGWGDFIAASMTDDDVAGDFVTGNLDRGIRRLPMTNYRWSYGAVDHRKMNVRRTNPAVAVPNDLQNPTSQTNPFAVHPIGELWSSTLWDMRELLIMKQKVGDTFPGVFFDGDRRLGNGASFFVGERQLKSVDAFHPINFRQEFNSTSTPEPPNTLPVPKILNDHFVRPGLVAQENAANSGRSGPLATAVSRAGRLTDQLVLRGLQLAPCNPSFVEMRDSILAADRELTGGENQAIIWRAFASHGVGRDARSTGGTGGTDANGAAQSAPTVVENFAVPVEVEECETAGPLPAPAFTLANAAANSVTITITPQAGASQYVIGRSANPNGPFATIATIPGTQTAYTDADNGDNLTLVKDQTYYYQVRAARNALCVSAATVNSVKIILGNPANPAPVFLGVTSVVDPRQNNRLVLNWSPATSLNPNANIVYDIYRVTSITTANGKNDSTTAPTFTPAAANRIAQDVTGTSFTDTNLTLGQVYYYIVQARDKNNGKKDTLDAGNTVAKFAAPTSNAAASTAFAPEDFETANANNRFTPILVDEANPNMALLAWQRVTGATPSAAMFAPDFDPTADGTGAPSDIFTNVALTGLTASSVMEFDSRFTTEFGFDGGNIELKLGAPFIAPDEATPYPNNQTIFDMNYFIFESGYTGKLDGTLAGPVILSKLQGRFAFTGTQDQRRVRVALGAFAPGGTHNPAGLPVYVRFRQTSDAGTSPGAGSGWYIDNLVVNNYVPALEIRGTVKYGSTPNGATPKFVPGATIKATKAGSPDINATSNDLGVYVLTGLASGGNYTVTPGKTSPANGISPLDATLLLRHVASNGTGQNALNENQQKAGDANEDGKVSPVDATMVLRYVASQGRAGNQTGNVGTWKFNPQSVPYPNLTESQISQDYTAFLIGDVNGSWSPSGQQFAEGDQSAEEIEQSANISFTDVAPGAAARLVKTDAPISPDGATLHLSLPTNASAATGEILEIPILLGNAGKARISGFAFDVEFDPNVLRPVSGNPVDVSGTLANNFNIVADTTSAADRIGLAAAGGRALIGSSGALVKLRFEVIGFADNSSGSTSLAKTRVSFEDGKGNPINTTAANGLVAIGR